MSIEEEELEQLPPQGHVKVVYLGPVAPHWDVHGVFGDGRLIDEFRQRALARLQLLPPHDPQFRRNRERVARDAERERLILEWDLGYEEPDTLERVLSRPAPEVVRLRVLAVTMKHTRCAMVTAWSAIRS